MKTKEKDASLPRRGIATRISLILLAIFILPSICSGSPVYTIKAGTPLKKDPSSQSASLRILDHNQSLEKAAANDNWVAVATSSGEKGWVRKDSISDTWVKVHRQERRLLLMKGDKVLRSYRAALCPSNPLEDKIKQGDGATPEGRFYICEMLRDPGEAKYGARAMRLSYPNIEDARRGLRDGMISFDAYRTILKEMKDGAMPNQRTPLGGSIRIHGGGSERDWTLGCVALDDRDVIELFDQMSLGTRAEVYRSAKQDDEINGAGYLNSKVLEGAREQLKSPALYTQEAMAATKLRYPMGDIRPDHAVCTDIVVRAMRKGDIDLQALLHEDISTHKDRYGIKAPDYSIDHRRTRNLQTYFGVHANVLPNLIDKTPAGEWRPGDIVVMDTGIQNGTPYDHIGILDKECDDQGLPMVINIWTVGYRTSSMDLLGNGYPAVVGHFRMTHPFDYQ